TTREEGKRGNFARSEIERLKALLHSNPYCSPSSLLRLEASTSGSLKKHGDERDNLHGITTPMVTSREIVVWTEDEADYPYFRSPPLKSRPWLGMDGATSDTIEETKPFHASLPAINHVITCKTCLKWSTCFVKEELYTKMS
ncbi:hypothetical protein Tco_1127048, partial [Tanacetum coccineum]